MVQPVASSARRARMNWDVSNTSPGAINTSSTLEQMALQTTCHWPRDPSRSRTLPQPWYQSNSRVRFSIEIATCPRMTSWPTRNSKSVAVTATGSCDMSRGLVRHASPATNDPQIATPAKAQRDTSTPPIDGHAPFRRTMFTRNLSNRRRSRTVRTGARSTSAPRRTGDPLRTRTR